MFLAHTAPEHADVVERAVVAACRGDGWGSPLQPRLLHTLFNRLLPLRTRFGIPPKSARVRQLDPYGALELPPGDPAA